MHVVLQIIYNYVCIIFMPVFYFVTLYKQCTWPYFDYIRGPTLPPIVVLTFRPAVSVVSPSAAGYDSLVIIVHVRWLTVIVTSMVPSLMVIDDLTVKYNQTQIIITYVMTCSRWSVGSTDSCKTRSINMISGTEVLTVHLAIVDSPRQISEHVWWCSHKKVLCFRE